MSAPLRTGRRLLRQRLTGVLFLGVLLGLVGLSVAQYAKAFSDRTTVFVEADRAGNQLGRGADVKVRGVLVGGVRRISSDGRGARLELALDPAAAARIPGDATAQMLPKTLFGEKQVVLSYDDASTAAPLRDGAVVPQDRSATARETGEALDGLLPLLQALRPEELSTTLNAVSGALRGRGERIGADLELVESYLRQLNPSVPELGEGLRGLADLADTLDAASPDLLAVLDDLSAVSGDLVETEPSLSAFLTTTTGAAGELGSFLGANEQRLVRLAADSLPSLQLYESFAPGLPCLARGLAASNEVYEDAFGGRQPGLHITLELVDDQGGFRPGDEPVYGDTTGPKCGSLPPQEAVRPFQPPYEPVDGYCDEQEARSPGVDTSDCRAQQTSAQPARALAAPREQERAAVGALTGPLLGLAPDDVPDLAVLLFGPVARGTEAALTR